MARTQRRLAAVLTRSLVLAVCWCLCPSPIPCCLYCGIGPCAQVPKFKKESDTKWVGTGESQLAGGCCTMCCHNEGDTMMIEGDKLVLAGAAIKGLITTLAAADAWFLPGQEELHA